MAIRNRSRKPLFFTGRRGLLPNSVYYSCYLNQESVMDHVLPGNGHGFALDKYYFHGKEFPAMNGAYWHAARLREYVDFPYGKIADPTYWLLHVPVNDIPTLAQAAAEIVAETNPSRPLVDLPVFAMELRELPGLLLKRSNDIGRDISSGRLSLEFGWKPLINDLVKLLTFKEAFQKRVTELNNLRQSGIRRKRIIFNGSATLIENVPQILHNADGLVVAASSTKATVSKVTGWVKWVPDAEIPRHLGMVNDGVQQKALFALLGLAPNLIDASTIWELIPFSWLADWCTNMGDYLAANRNIVGAHPEKILIMRHTHTEQLLQFSTANDITSKGIYALCKSHMDTFKRHRDTKTRDPAFLVVEAHMPFLSERKVMILGDIVRNNFRSGKFR